MMTQEQTAELHAVFDGMLGTTSLNALAKLSPPIDVEAPNQHATKKDFSREKKAVQESIKHIDGLFKALVARKADREDLKEVLDDLAGRIDTHARANKINADKPSSLDLIRANAQLVGLREVSLWLLVDLREALTDRLEELMDQEVEFWTVKNRPPNYYARTIALRTARKYARDRGEYPTLGTSRDSGEPSTEFARGLKEVFQILEIQAAVRGPAEWAISQLTEDDIKPTQGSLASALAWNPKLPPSANSLDPIIEALLPPKKGTGD